MELEQKSGKNVRKLAASIAVLISETDAFGPKTSSL